ncbi:MAG TPA: hypothetical protein PKA20_02730 [Burkholderiaceae bacterium]|nr:hypothetical protein [Burkholderiaceae bacterium]
MKSIAIAAVSAGFALLAAGVQAQTVATPEASKNGGLVAPASPGNAGESATRAPSRMKSDEERRVQRDLNAANAAAVRAATGTTPPAQGTSMGAGPSANSGASIGSSGSSPAARIPSGTATQ